MIRGFIPISKPVFLSVTQVISVHLGGEGCDVGLQSAAEHPSATSDYLRLHTDCHRLLMQGLAEVHVGAPA